jgi:hypothetical protein
MNSNGLNILGCATFGLDDIISGSDGTIIKDHTFSPSCVLLPGHPFGSIITGNRARGERIHSGLPWPPEACIKNGKHLRRAPVSCVWRALVEARDSQARWEVGGGVSFPLAKILAAHIINLSAPNKSLEKLSYVVTIPNDLDEYGQENLISEMRRELEKRDIRGEVQLLWRPVAAALAWLHKAVGELKVTVLKNNPDDFLLVLYLGPDGIECVTFHLAIKDRGNKYYVLPRRKRQSNLSPLVGYDWIGSFLEEKFPNTREGDDGAFWQAFTKFPEVWQILAGRDFQNDNLPRVWGRNGEYALWHPDKQEYNKRMELVSGGPSEWVQSILKPSCTLKGSKPSVGTWPEQLTELVTESVQKHTSGRMVGMVVCGPLAPPTIPSWLKNCVPVLEAHGLITEKPWDTRGVGHIWLSPGSEAIAQGALLFQERLNNEEPTYLDTLPKYFLLAKEREYGGYKIFPLVDAPDVEGGKDYCPEPIKGRFEILKDSRKIDIVIVRDDKHENLLQPVGSSEMIDREICRDAEGLSIAGAALVRHFVRTANDCEKALQSVKMNQKNIQEIIPGSTMSYGRKFADIWHESGIENRKQLSLWQNDHNEQLTKETPFRLLSFPFSVPSPKKMPVDIHVRIRPASGMAHMDVRPKDPSFLRGRSVFVDYQTMRPCQPEELTTDTKGWPPLDELAPHPDPAIWSGINSLIKAFEQTTPHTEIFTINMQKMYDFLRTPKVYFYPVEWRKIYLPVLNQDGLAGSPIGEELIARFSKALQIHSSSIRTWNAKLITRATWLYGSTPKIINTRIMDFIQHKKAKATTCQAASRSLTETSNLHDLFKYIAQDIRNRGVLVMPNIRAINNILSLRNNGQSALRIAITTTFMNALLNESDKSKYHYTPKFFTCLRLLLFLLRYRKCDEQFLPYDSDETNKIKEKLIKHLPLMRKNMTEKRYQKSEEAINGIIDYLNFKGKTTLIDTLNFLSDDEKDDEE